MWLPRVLTRWFRAGSSQAEKRLVQRCAGDLGQAERLIGHELARRPRLSRTAACEAAVDRWNRDR
jgi:hypothetical protein